MNTPMSSERSWFWSDSFSSAPGWLITLISVLLFITLVMWIFLPFAIYGAKTILREQNVHLAEIRSLLKKALPKIEPSDSTEPQAPNNAPHDT